MRATWLSMSVVLALVGCGAPSSRTITGQVSSGDHALGSTVVVAQSPDHRSWIAPVTANGRFTLTLPAGGDYRMTLASASTRAGVYTATARIAWPTATGPSRWAHVSGGAAYDLGAVYLRGTKMVPANTTGGGECRQEDGAKTETHKDDADCDCEHQADDDDGIDEDADGDAHDQMCGGDSDGDGDGHHDGDDGDDGHDGDDHDDDGCGCDAGTNSGGTSGGGTSGGGTSALRPAR